MKQNRFKSPVLWAALVVQVCAILVSIGVIDVSQSETINSAFSAVLQVLVIFGVLNNPTDKGAF